MYLPPTLCPVSSQKNQNTMNTRLIRITFSLFLALGVVTAGPLAAQPIIFDDLEHGGSGRKWLVFVWK